MIPIDGFIDPLLQFLNPFTSFGAGFKVAITVEFLYQILDTFGICNTKISSSRYQKDLQRQYAGSVVLLSLLQGTMPVTNGGGIKVSFIKNNERNSGFRQA